MHTASADATVQATNTLVSLSSKVSSANVTLTRKSVALHPNAIGSLSPATSSPQSRAHYSLQNQVTQPRDYILTSESTPAADPQSNLRDPFGFALSQDQPTPIAMSKQNKLMQPQAPLSKQPSHSSTQSPPTQFLHYGQHSLTTNQSSLSMYSYSHNQLLPQPHTLPPTGDGSNESCMTLTPGGHCIKLTITNTSLQFSQFYIFGLHKKY